MSTENEQLILDAIAFDEGDCDLTDIEGIFNDERALEGIFNDERALQGKLQECLWELEYLEEDRKLINNPDHLGDTIMDVVWEQFLTQMANTAGEEFVKENGGLLLDLRDEAHIQTAENFSEGKIATHNHISREQLEQNYDRYTNTPHKEFRKSFVDPGMDATLKRVGELKKQGIDTVNDIYTGKQIPTDTKLDNGKNNSKAGQREHVKPSAQLYENPSLQMANSNEELAAIINNPENLQGYTTAERNNRKSDKTADEMDARDKTKHWEKADERADQFVEQKEKEGEDRLREEGRKTQNEEAKRIGKEALKAVFMRLLAELVKEVIKKLVKWLKSATRKIETLIAAVKEAITSFVGELKTHLQNAFDTAITTVASAIFGPVVGIIRKTITLLKQGWNALKEAIQYLRDPKNKGKPLSCLLPQVGIIVVTGLSGVGAIVLGEYIEKSLMAVPFFAIDIPAIGSLANLIGTLMGAVVCGIIGAIAINLINRHIAKQQMSDNLGAQISKKGEIIVLQDQNIDIKREKHSMIQQMVVQDMAIRHKETRKQLQETRKQMTNPSIAAKQKATQEDLSRMLQDCRKRKE